jgi:hypothetical protein
MIFLTEGRGFLFSEMDNKDQDDCRVCGEVCNAAVTTPCCDAKVKVDPNYGSKSDDGIRIDDKFEFDDGFVFDEGSEFDANSMRGPNSMRIR